MKGAIREFWGDALLNEVVTGKGHLFLDRADKKGGTQNSGKGQSSTLEKNNWVINRTLVKASQGRLRGATSYFLGLSRGTCAIAWE